MSLKTLGAEVSPSMGGPALGGTIANTLAEFPAAATATASFETMVSGAMKFADGSSEDSGPFGKGYGYGHGIQSKRITAEFRGIGAGMGAGGIVGGPGGIAVSSSVDAFSFGQKKP
jgi:hypothetical protein